MLRNYRVRHFYINTLSTTKFNKHVKLRTSCMGRHYNCTMLKAKDIAQHDKAFSFFLLFFFCQIKYSKNPRQINHHVRKNIQYTIRVYVQSHSIPITYEFTKSAESWFLYIANFTNAILLSESSIQYTQWFFVSVVPCLHTYFYA